MEGDGRHPSLTSPGKLQETAGIRSAFVLKCNTEIAGIPPPFPLWKCKKLRASSHQPLKEIARRDRHPSIIFSKGMGRHHGHAPTMFIKKWKEIVNAPSTTCMKKWRHCRPHHLHEEIARYGRHTPIISIKGQKQWQASFNFCKKEWEGTAGILPPYLPRNLQEIASFTS